MKPDFSAAILFPFVLSCLVCSNVDAAWISEEQAIMGTRVKVELWSEDEQLGKKAIAAVMSEMHRIDREMSPYKPESRLSEINAHAADRAVTPGAELFDLIRESLRFSKVTAGAFDITFASAGHMYDYRQHKRPDKKQLKAVLNKINYRHVLLHEKDKSIRFAKPGVRIDLGGIAKGYAVDRGIAILRKQGIQSALVSAGGDSRVMGDRRGRPWIMGIRDPRNEKGMVALFPLQDEAVSTSGDYERYFEEDGVRYHHIIHPQTGDSVRHIRSVTILGKEATTTDALSTSIFVMGAKKGLELVESLVDIEVVIVDSGGRMHTSSGLDQLRRQAK